MPESFTVTVPFGGGVHSRASPQDIPEMECQIGQNFDLDPQNREFRNRNGFDLIGTVPNASEIRGGATLQKSDGTNSFLVQAGDTVYEWDGITTFTSKGTVNAQAKLRGRLEHNWQLDDKVIITDLNLQQPVMEWDGTTLQNVSFFSNPSTAWTGDFKARYCDVTNERVLFANVNDNGTDFPHLIVGSQRGDFTIISNSDRPSSALSEEDPFFLIQPDYRYINGMVEAAFGLIVTSSREGSMFKLIGTSSKDFAFDELYPRSGADGDESVAYVGNDIAYGRKGRIESLIDTDRSGDVETNDMSRDIFDQIETYMDWMTVYNSRTQRVHFIADSTSIMWTFHKPMMSTQLSPWSRWITAHSSSFQPTFMMNMIDPSDGLEYVFFGDGSGNFYRLEGSGSDAGSSIKIIRKSKLFSVPINAEAFNLHGEVVYKSNNAFTLQLDLLWQGRSIMNITKTLSIPAVSNRSVYGGGTYYSDGSGYGSFSGSFTRKHFEAAGKSNAFQVQLTIDGTVDFSISEVRLEFQASP